MNCAYKSGAQFRYNKSDCMDDKNKKEKEHVSANQYKGLSSISEIVTSMSVKCRMA